MENIFPVGVVLFMLFGAYACAEAIIDDFKSKKERQKYKEAQAIENKKIEEQHKEMEKINLEDQISSLYEELKSISAKKKERERELSELSTKLEAGSTELNKVEIQKTEHWDSAKKAQQTKRDTEKSIERLKSTINELEEESNRLTGNIGALNSQIAKKKDELASTAADLEAAKTKRTELNKEMKEKKASIKEYENNQAAEIQEKSKQAATDAKKVISSAEAKAKTIIANAMTEANAIKDDASGTLADAEKFKKVIEDNAEQTSLEAHLDWFATKIDQTDAIVLSYREKARELHATLTNALEKSQGTKNGAAPDINQAMNKGDKIDLLYRFYSQKIAEYKADDSLDPDIQQAALLGLQEQMERQIQEISGAFEPE